MPILSEFRRKLSNSPDEEMQSGEETLTGSCDETLICDARSTMRFPQFIERKIGIALSRENARQQFDLHASRARFE